MYFTNKLCGTQNDLHIFLKFIWRILKVYNYVCTDKGVAELQQTICSQQMAGYPSLSHPATYWVQPRLPSVHLCF